MVPYNGIDNGKSAIPDLAIAQILGPIPRKSWIFQVTKHRKSWCSPSTAHKAVLFQRKVSTETMTRGSSAKGTLWSLWCFKPSGKKQPILQKSSPLWEANMLHLRNMLKGLSNVGPIMIHLMIPTIPAMEFTLATFASWNLISQQGQVRMFLLFSRMGVALNHPFL